MHVVGAALPPFHRWGALAVPVPVTSLERPAPGDLAWQDIDEALDTAVRSAEPTTLVVLVADDADGIARTLFVLEEPMTDLVIAVGYRDRSIAWTATNGLGPSNDRVLHDLAESVRVELARGDLGAALRAVAAAMRRLRRARSARS